MRMGHGRFFILIHIIHTDRKPDILTCTIYQNLDIFPLGLFHPRHTGCAPRERLSAADRIAASLWRRPITTGILMKQCERDWAHLEHSPKAFDVDRRDALKAKQRSRYSSLSSTLLISLGLMLFNQRSGRGNNTCTWFGEPCTCFCFPLPL